MLKKGNFCLCIENTLRLKIGVRHSDEGKTMEFESNRSARLFSVALIPGLLACWQRFRSWRLRKQTQRILLHLNETQLKDIGLTAEDIRRYR